MSGAGGDEPSPVNPSVVLPLGGEAEHTADHTAAHGTPVLIADLLPPAAVLHLHVALGHRDPLPVGGQDGLDAHVLHLDGQVLDGGETRPGLNKQSGFLMSVTEERQSGWCEAIRSSLFR